MSVTSDINIAASQHLGELVNNGDFSRLDEVFAADVVDHDPAPDQGPGPDGFKAFFASLGAAFPDAHIDVETMIADDDTVAFAYTLTGTQEGDFEGIPATGRSIRVRGLQISKFRNGMIVERWGSSDQLGILQQLGAKVSAGS